MRTRTLTALTLAAALALVACGGDDDDAATESTAAAPVTTAAAAPDTTAAAPDTIAAADTTEAADTTAAAPAFDADAEAAALAWTAAFDSTTGFDEKAPYIADAEALRPTIEAYTPAGEAVGGIALSPTAVVVDADTATITYDVMFAGQPAYQGQEGVAQRVDGTWRVSRDEFCGFMAAARNPCP